MARMVATKAALSIRVDALSDADSKSSAAAATIGIENRAKLESRLRALEYRNDLTTTTPFKGEKKKEQPKVEMKTGVKQYNTAADAVGFLPTQRQGAEALAINAVLDVKEERRREKEEKRRAKEAKNKRRAEEAAAAAAIEEEAPDPEPKDGMSFACDPFIYLLYSLDAISVPMETEEDRKERKRLKKEKKRVEAAAAADAAIAAAISPTRAEGSEKKKSKKRKHDEDEMEIDGEKKKKKRRKE
jgi:nucleolar protein 58